MIGMTKASARGKRLHKKAAAVPRCMLGKTGLTLAELGALRGELAEWLARPRAEVLSALHANIQDVFNEHGVQIMSPHYMTDPAAQKIVPPGQWFTSPARPVDIEKIAP
mgnify:CR=1 FL=1